MTQKNVFGDDLIACCFDPITGVTRSGFCESLSQDRGKHWVCAKLTNAFLDYSLSQGNDLKTPRPEYGFMGLKANDYWCLCVSRWLEALTAGCAPPLKLEACHSHLLKSMSLSKLTEYAITSE